MRSYDRSLIGRVIKFAGILIFAIGCAVLISQCLLLLVP